LSFRSEPTFDPPELESPQYLDAFTFSLWPFSIESRANTVLIAESADKFEQSYFKQLTQKTILFGGISILALYMLASAGYFLLDWQNSAMESHLDQIRPLIYQKEKQLKIKQQLDILWLNYSQLKNRKSYLHFYLYQIARQTPQTTWVGEITYYPSSGQRPGIQIQGFSLSEQSTAMFLEQLELLPFTQNTRLDELMVYEGEEVYKKWKLNYKTLIQFRIHFDV
jgi:hypothetical protein